MSMSNGEIGDIAIDLANGFERLAVGKPTAAVYSAIAMILGVAERRAERPDVDGLMRILRAGVIEVLDRPDLYP